MTNQSIRQQHDFEEFDKPKASINEFNPKIRWPDLIAQISIHIGSLIGLYFLLAFKAKFFTYLWCK